MSTSSAPIEIGRVALTVNDIGGMAEFYQTVMGLERIGGDSASAVFGAGGKALLELRADPAARRRSPSEAGLFHTAFLLPSRAALGKWLHNVAARRVQLSGASDHLVSEAIYLDDPEGNGIEIYHDRPRESWPKDGDRIRMATNRLDLDDVANSADGAWNGAPDGTVIGHVHLQVGSVPEAEAFYGDMLGFKVMAHYPGASFLGSGGYHHHFGANTWNSRGAGRRSYPSTGLADIQLLADADVLADIKGRVPAAGPMTDPWGTSVTLSAKTGAA